MSSSVAAITVLLVLSACLFVDVRGTIMVMSPCTAGPCDHQCIDCNPPCNGNSYRCECFAGHVLHADGTSCISTCKKVTLEDIQNLQIRKNGLNL